MKLSTQVSTSVLSRGPTRKELGEVLLRYYFLKDRDNEGRTLSDTRRALKTQGNSGSDINNWPSIIILKLRFAFSNQKVLVKKEIN